MKGTGILSMEACEWPRCPVSNVSISWPLDCAHKFGAIQGAFQKQREYSRALTLNGTYSTYDLSSALCPTRRISDPELGARGRIRIRPLLSWNWNPMRSTHTIIHLIKASYYMR